MKPPAFPPRNTNKGEEKEYYGVFNDQNQPQYHIKIPGSFVAADTSSRFIKYIVPMGDKAQNRKNMFTKAYDGLLGNEKISDNPNTEDGWKYRGRGAIQLTGKGNYRTNQNEISKRFQLTFDLLNNPNLVASNNSVIVYSAIAFVLQNVSKIDEVDQMTIDQFSALINTGNSSSSISNVNGADDRRLRYKTLIENEDLFKCKK